MKKIYNPLDVNSDLVELVDVFQTSQIINDYKNIGIDVSRFFKDSKIQLYKCKRTGYKFYYPFSSIGDALFYENLSKNRKNYYSRRWEHNESLNYINSSDSVLEIGSGFGSFLKLLKNNNIKSKGLELNSFAVETCKKEGLSVENKLIQELVNNDEDLYDVVCSFQVLEHIVEVNSFLDSSIKALKKGGKLIIGVPNNNPYLFINDRYHTLNLPPHHAGLWNKESLKSLEKLFPLKLEKLIFEPISKTYSYFIESYIKNMSNRFLKKLIHLTYRLFPKILKLVICNFMDGRNVVGVYKKIS